MKKQMISGNIILKLDGNSQSTQMTDEGCKLPKFVWNWNYYSYLSFNISDEKYK
jgi:hypothetical protein